MKKKLSLIVLSLFLMIIVAMVAAAEPNVYYFKVPSANYALTPQVTNNGVVLHETGGDLTQTDIDQEVSLDQISQTPNGEPVTVRTDKGTSSAINWFQNPSSKVSAHMVVARNGDIFIATDNNGIGLMDARARAFHAGTQGGNDFFGVEFSSTGIGTETLTQAQKDAIPYVVGFFAEQGATKYLTHKDVTINLGGTNHPDGEPVRQAFIEKNLNDQFITTFAASSFEKLPPPSNLGALAAVAAQRATAIPGTAAATTATVTPTAPPRSCTTQICNELDEAWTKIHRLLFLNPDSAQARKVWDPVTGWIDFVRTSPTGAVLTTSQQWKFQRGVEKQWDDASPELQELLGCLRAKLPASIGEISSIGDRSGFTSCRYSWTDQACAHAQGSSHYGCGTGTKSYAVDFGDQINTCQIVEAAVACGVQKKHIIGPTSRTYFSQCGDKYTAASDHNNHVHISVNSASCY